MRATERLAQLLETELGEPVDPGICREMVREGYLADLETGDTTVEHVVQEYRRRVRKRQVREQERELPGLPADTRLEVLSRILALEASRLPEVQRFRQEVLGGRLLAVGDIPRWIEEQVRKEGPATVFVSLQVALPADARPRDSREALAMAKQVLASAEPVRMALERETLECPGPPPGVEMEDAAAAVLAATPGWRYHLSIRVGGTMWRLKRLAQQLTRLYPWREHQAVAFVLAGVTPLLARASVRLLGMLPGKPLTAWARIVLELDPRLPASEVALLYRRLRGEAYRGTDRPMSQKNLQLALFLAEQQDRSATWRELMAAWNERFPKWRYTNYRRFARDAALAWHRVTGRKWEGKGRHGEA